MKKYIALGGTLLAAALAALAIAVWPASETARAEMDAAVADTRSHAGDELAEQVDDQTDALARAADGFAGSVTTDDAWGYDLYQAELDVALDDLTENASDFRGQGPEVHQAFWQGVEDGVNS